MSIRPLCCRLKHGTKHSCRVVDTCTQKMNIWENRWEGTHALCRVVVQVVCTVAFIATSLSILSSVFWCSFCPFSHFSKIAYCQPWCLGTVARQNTANPCSFLSLFCNVRIESNLFVYVFCPSSILNSDFFLLGFFNFTGVQAILVTFWSWEQFDNLICCDDGEKMWREKEKKKRLRLVSKVVVKLERLFRLFGDQNFSPIFLIFSYYSSTFPVRRLKWSKGMVCKLRSMWGISSIILSRISTV